MRQPKIVQTPCCNIYVKVTTRKSKLSERPRIHPCTCGKVYRIGADYQPKAS